MKAISESDKNTILELRAKGLTVMQVCKQTGLSKTTVFKISADNIGIKSALGEPIQEFEKSDRNYKIPNSVWDDFNTVTALGRGLRSGIYRIVLVGGEKYVTRTTAKPREKLIIY